MAGQKNNKEENSKIEINKLFENNYYLSKEYADFFNKITDEKIKKIKDYYSINNTIIGIDNFPKKDVNYFRKNKIKFLNVLSEKNNNNSSLEEYPVIFRDSYKNISEKFSRSHKKRVKRANKELKSEILNSANKKILDEIYEIYKENMKSKNSFYFSKKYFEEFNKLKHSLFFLVKKNDKILAFAACYENKDNLYFSIGVGINKYYSENIMHKLYDDRIKYACNKKLNIHLGIGMKDSGYNKLKYSIGGIALKTETLSNNDFILENSAKLLKFKLVGLILSYISRKWPKKVIMEMMPFT